MRTPFLQCRMMFRRLTGTFTKDAAESRRTTLPPHPRPLKVLVVGGGPAGLAAATALRSMMGQTVKITVCDARWTRRRGRFVWRDEADGVVRREQVVTLQSLVWSRLPQPVQAALFPPQGYSEMWPTGGGSPRDIGFPRNVRIRDIEDRLLRLAHDQDLSLIAERVEPASFDFRSFDVVAMADGTGSRTRDHFASVFGPGDPTPFSLNGTPVEDAVLGMRVTSQMPDPDGVVLTVAQNRFLLNTLNGEGYLYMRLTPDEAKEVRGRNDARAVYMDCIQSRPCVMRADNGRFRCKTHGTYFAPARDTTSFLYPRMIEGLRLFDVPLDDLQAVTMFRLSMVRRRSFVGEITPLGDPHPVFGALIGDAAIGIHFWPGKGLNTGLASAVALARTLTGRWKGTGLRSADFTGYEAAMAALAHRNQGRAWRAMVMPSDGQTVPVTSVIAHALDQSAADRGALLARPGAQIEDLAARLSPRLPGRPSDQAVVTRLSRLSTETLAAFDAAGPWETRWSGGAEVDLDRLVPNVEDQNRESRQRLAS